MRDPRNKNHRPHRRSVSNTWGSLSVRRGHDRVFVRQPALLSHQGPHQPILTRDLSEGGAFLTTVTPPEIGEVVEVLLPLNEDEFLCLNAIVRWHDVDSKLRPLGCGVEFIDLTPDSRADLQTLIAQDRLARTGT